MDKHEKSALRKKRPLLMNVLSFTEEKRKIYIAKGLLTKDIDYHISQHNKTERGRLSKWFEYLTTLEETNVFDKICQLLIDEKQDWLADEIKAYVLSQKGEILVEDYVMREAASDVHKEFGSSRRVSERDKKGIEAIIAERHQSTKEAWSISIRSLRQQLDDLRNERWKDSTKINELTEKIDIYLRIQKNRINNEAHDTQRPLNPDSSTTDNNLDKLECQVDILLKSISRILFDNENYLDERKRIIELLDLNKGVTKLDMYVAEALERAKTAADKKDSQARVSNEAALSFQSQLKSFKIDADRQLEEKLRNEKYLKTLNEQRRRNAEGLQKLLLSERHRIKELEEDVNKWKAKCEQLEKTRRLGYHYPGWYNVVYKSCEMNKRGSMPSINRSKSNYTKPTKL
ncbi:DgyrCDS10335 [Dimorphilus gyrociliatus]|uniref:DgyrCDS10335 n=1 Tax=Dimorphilus gyrociliatus TaxID=2664684 RepID=A0A7I8W042_9ANNE|nr:DgyrCDS10335 [Dimorphilus gyrociliatus]